MKTKPDDSTLTQWMDGELEGESLHHVEAWVQDHPELLAERDAVQAMSASIQENIPNSVEPPYPDFFNQRILHAIEEEHVATRQTEPQTTPRGFWQWLVMPIAAGAMAICFYLGTQMNSTPATSGATLVVNEAPKASVYTPDGAVSANMFKSTDAKATVIVLEGLEDLPDDLEMAGGPSTGPSDSMMINTDESKLSF